MDRRTTPSNGRVAHVSLKGKVDAERFLEGEAMQFDCHHAAILSAPGGPRVRELLAGEAFRVLEMPADVANGTAFGFSERDGYVGYVASGALVPARPATHVVATRETYRKEMPDLKYFERTSRMPFGTRVVVTGTTGDWSAISLRAHPPSETGRDWTFHVPTVHLRPTNRPFDDPAAVAELFLHTPYLWGGNTSFGIDCSGLVQAALLACGIPCPGDSDQQEARVGRPLPPCTSLERNDLVFWKGHVAIALDADTIIHANVHHMAVAIEGFETARHRIAASGGGGVTLVRRT